MIGITGVTGKLGSYVADLVDQQGISSIHLARRPERAKVYASAEIRKMVYANTPEVVDALKGIDVLLMLSARENPERVEEHKSFLDAAKLAGVQHIVYTSSRVAAEILLNPKEWGNQTLNLTGPEDLSMEEIVELLSKETGNAITYVDESVEEAYESRKKWPAQNWEYDAWVSTYTAIKVGEQAGVSTDVEKVLGRPAMSLEEVLKSSLSQ